ncbi:MAG: pyrroloquinoline quinone biosynthesis protein PqqE [Polyangiales bacterium]
MEKSKVDVRPYTLVAELTYKCPLRCPYCANPTSYRDHKGELTTAEWSDVFAQARDLGVLQLHLTGGEPLARRDLEALVAHARALDLYTNLITSGIPLARERLVALRDAGLDNVQVSVQDAHAESADRIAGYPGFTQKLEVMRWVKQLGLPLTMNVVLHRDNLANVGAIIALAESLAVDRLELANTQYLGWALENREQLMPSRDALVQASVVAKEATERLRGRMEVLFVIPDYFARHPRACMDGWARRFLHIMPDGTVLPCHAAIDIPSLTQERVPARSLRWIWEESQAFNAFRGESWMKEPCSSCDRREIDFGGCRCQALRLTGDAAAADPACARSPHHHLVQTARLAADGTGERRYLMRGARAPR